MRTAATIEAARCLYNVRRRWYHRAHCELPMIAPLDVRTACAALDPSALRHNLALLRSRLARETRLLAVVKADGYGHGAVLVATQLAAAGADWFGVATVDEAAELRAAGIRHPVLVLSGVHGKDLLAVAELELAVALLDMDHLHEIESLHLSRRLTVHLKVDTGMGRLGVDLHHLPALLDAVANSAAVSVGGVFSHFARAEAVDSNFCRSQLEAFRQAVALVRQRWPRVIAHLANSAATWTLAESHFDMVRPGLLLYGVSPGPGLGTEQFRAAMQLSAPVIQVRELPAGRPVGYGQTFITQRPTRVAVLGIGYADGYDRRLSNSGAVLLRGCRVPVIGRVCMDVTLVDVTELPAVEVGDRAVLWGPAGEHCLPVEEVARCADAIPYELLSRLGRRVKRCLAQLELTTHSRSEADVTNPETQWEEVGTWQRSSAL